MDTRDGPLAFLAQAQPDQVARCLISESETIAGLVLAQLPPPFAAKVLANFTEDRQRAVVAAMRRARAVPSDRLTRIASSLRQRLDASQPSPTTAPAGDKPAPLQAWRPRRVSNANVVNPPPPDETKRREEAIARTLAQARQKVAASRPAQASIPRTPAKGKAMDGMAIAAEILRQADPTVRHNISDQAPDLYEDLRQRMFCFEDLIRTPERGLAEIFSQVDAKEAALALRFAAPALTDRALAAVSPRRAALLRDEMGAGLAAKGRVRVRDIEQAQQHILEIALGLQQAGKIVIDPSDPDLAT